MDEGSPADGTKFTGGLRADTWLPWVLGDAFILCFLIRDFLLTRGLAIDRLDVWGRDFVNVWTGGQLVRAGQLATLSNVAAFQAYQRHLFGAIGPHNYSYPPVTFPVAGALAFLPYPLALLTWQLAGAAFFIWAARPWWPQRSGPAWLAVLTPAAVVNLWAGHYGFFIGGLFLLGWRQVERGRSSLAGLCFGLMLIKPHLAVLVPLALALRREWHAIAWAAVTVLLLVAATSAIYGIEPWRDFLFDTTPTLASFIDARESFFGLMSTSASTAMLSIGASSSWALAVQAIFAAASVGAVIWAGSRSMPLRDYALLTSTATFLILPYGFNYDMTVPMIGALAIMTAGPRSPVDRRLAFYGFIAPQFGMIAAAIGLPIMPLLIAGLLFAQLRMAGTLDHRDRGARLPS